MLPLRIVESDRPDFDEPVVELWREDEFVGMVFWDGEEAIVQVYPDVSGDVYDIEIGDLQRVLDLAVRIVSPEGERDDAEGGDYLAAFNATLPPEGAWDEEDPATRAFSEEFDERVTLRTEDGEGFFDRATALELVARCEELGLAVVELDGFHFDGARLQPRPELGVAITSPAGLEWAVSRAAANAQVRAALESWPVADSLVAAFVIQQPDGETFIA